jgi:hypothetical protein
MENSTTQTTPDPFDLTNLVISQDYLATAGTTKLLTTVKVGRPNRQDFFRINADPAYRGIFSCFESKEDRASYIVTKAMADVLSGETFFATIFTGVTKLGNPFVWPVRLPGTDGRQNEWHRTALVAVEEAMTRWVRVASNMGAGGYDVLVANSDLGEPKWPDKSFQDLLRIAYRNEGIVESEDHPVVKKLYGLV